MVIWNFWTCSQNYSKMLRMFSVTFWNPTVLTNSIQKTIHNWTNSLPNGRNAAQRTDSPNFRKSFFALIRLWFSPHVNGPKYNVPFDICIFHADAIKAMVVPPTNSFLNMSSKLEILMPKLSINSMLKWHNDHSLNKKCLKKEKKSHHYWLSGRIDTIL